jgi:DNA-binding response OmpR family regulator
VVEDDAGVARSIGRQLRDAQYTVDTAPDGEEALFLAPSGEYDLILLDLLLPKRNGIDVLRTLRSQGVTAPVLVLTGRDDLRDKVEGLDAGADDYVTKPFRVEEIMARARALLRRRGDLVPTLLRVADLELDGLRHRVQRAGRAIALTNREYALLEYLMRHADEVVTRTALSEHVWEQSFDPLSNVIDVHVARLRRKIDDGFPVRLLQTVRGKGYILRGDQTVPAQPAAVTALPAAPPARLSA